MSNLHETLGREADLLYLANDQAISTRVGKKQGRSIRSTNKEGYLVCGPYVKLDKGFHTIFFYGDVFDLSGKVEIDISCDKGEKIISKQQIKGASGIGVISIVRIYLDEECRDVEFRIYVDEAADIKFDALEVYSGEYVGEFSSLNKSYKKDLEWTLVLYQSYEKFFKKEAPFYLVVPWADAPEFHSRFSDMKNSGIINNLPMILFEEWVLSSTGSNIPENFDGWRIQQVIKLCFSKLFMSRKYITFDSAQFFSRDFDYKEHLYVGDILKTAAIEQNRYEKNKEFIESGELCWLKGNLVNASVAFDFIDEQFSELNEKKYHYIGCNGFFDSAICSSLERWAYNNGYDGFVGLIVLAPYEFAWYGSYVTYMEKELFFPVDPLIFLPIINESAVEEIKGLHLRPHHDQYGYLFQPPASNEPDPESLYQASLKINN